MTAPPKRHLLRGRRTVCGIIPRMAAAESLTLLESRITCGSCRRLLELEKARTGLDFPDWSPAS